MFTQIQAESLAQDSPLFLHLVQDKEPFQKAASHAKGVTKFLLKELPTRHMLEFQQQRFPDMRGYLHLYEV